MGIQTVAGRNKLGIRREPYWHQLASGQHLGFRKTEKGGHWIARNYDSTKRRREYRALALRSIPDAQQFTAAVKAAREWFEHLEQGGSSKAGTVREACDQYVKKLKADGREKAAKDAESRFKRMIDGDPIAIVPLQKLAKHHVADWRSRLIAAPAVAPKRGENYRGDDPLPPKRSRSKSSHNRDFVALRAALNLAKENGHVTSDLAWSTPLTPFENAGRRRTLYLDRGQRRALVDALPKDLAPFIRCLCMLPLRPGAAAALTVGSFDKRTGELTIHGDKAHRERRILLPDAATQLLREQSRDKLPSAYLFTRIGRDKDGEAVERPWDKDSWKGPIAEAVNRAKLPRGTTAYTLRHSTITDLVTSGLDLFTVAALSGTSVKMIEQHYGHLRQDRAREALQVLSL